MTLESIEFGRGTNQPKRQGVLDFGFDVHQDSQFRLISGTVNFFILCSHADDLDEKSMIYDAVGMNIPQFY